MLQWHSREQFTNNIKLWLRGGKYMMNFGSGLGYGVFGLFFILIYLGFFALSVYLMISAIIFFKQKTENDSILLRKLDELIRIQSQAKDNNVE
jgi:hypothetical protein